MESNSLPAVSSLHSTRMKSRRHVYGTYLVSLLVKKKILILPRKMNFLFIILLHIYVTSANVHWKLKENRIILGKPISLECTTSSKNFQDVSRRWTGGMRNRLLCFNGVTTNPSKYKETEDVSGDTFTLQINETSEDDLECPYSCRFGFQSDEKILYVTKDNFLYLPNENTTKVDYGMNDENYTLHLDFMKVFPEPVCGIQIQNIQRTLIKVKESKSRVFFNLSYKLESIEPLHACGNQLEIKCTIGKTLYSVYRPHDLSCTALDTPNSAKVYIAIAFTLAALVVIMFILYRKRIKVFVYLNRSGNQTSQRSDCGDRDARRNSLLRPNQS